MSRLEGLKKESRLALGKFQLVAIACVSKSRSNAYNLARRCGWDEPNARSAQSLANIYFELGDDAFQDVLRGIDRGFMGRICSNSDHHERGSNCCGAYDNICFCLCHFCRSCDRGVDSCDGNCGHECHDEGGWCRHCADWHQAQSDSSEWDYEDNDYSPDEWDEDENDDEDESDDEGDDDQDAGAWEDGDSESESEPESDRLERIRMRLDAAGADFAGEYFIVDEIDGARLQACAIVGRNGVARVEVTSGLMEALDDDELAFVVAHEIAHHEHRDHVRSAELERRLKQTTIRLAESLDDDLKAAGRGWLTRGVAMIGASMVGELAKPLAIHHASRYCEAEADERAVSLAAAADFDPTKAESALRKLHGGQLQDIGVLGTLTSTHPNPAQRGEDVARKSRKK